MALGSHPALGFGPQRGGGQSTQALQTSRLRSRALTDQAGDPFDVFDGPAEIPGGIGPNLSGVAGQQGGGVNMQNMERLVREQCARFLGNNAGNRRFDGRAPSGAERALREALTAGGRSPTGPGVPRSIASCLAVVWRSSVKC